MTIYAFIPFRSGSSRLKNKNIKVIKKRPLVYWTVKIAILNSKIDKVILSTDSKKYYNKVIYFLKKDRISSKKIIFDKREKKFSNSKFKIFDYVKKILTKKIYFSKKDLIVQMLPTLPLRSKKFVTKCINFSLKKKMNVFSANEYDFHISFAFFLTQNFKWKNVLKNTPMKNGNTRGQDQKKAYHPNGLVNCVWYKNLLKNKYKTYYFNALPVISPKYMSFDIDNVEDFQFLKKLIH